jgi:hypothetical protein
VICPSDSTPLRALDMPPSLTKEECLELLALGEVLARKAGYGGSCGFGQPGWATPRGHRSGRRWDHAGRLDARTRWIEDRHVLPVQRCPIAG